LPVASNLVAIKTGASKNWGIKNGNNEETFKMGYFTIEKKSLKITQLLMFPLSPITSGF